MADVPLSSISNKFGNRAVFTSKRQSIPPSTPAGTILSITAPTGYRIRLTKLMAGAPTPTNTISIKSDGQTIFETAILQASNLSIDNAILLWDMGIGTTNYIAMNSSRYVEGKTISIESSSTISSTIYYQYQIWG